MCFANKSTMYHSLSDKSHTRGEHGFGSGRCGNGQWKPFNIAAMVLGFIFFWPVGLLILFWIIAGRDVRDLPSAIQRQWTSFFGKDKSTRGDSDNVVFNDYQQTQYDRIDEIKQEIKDRKQRFQTFRADAKRRADEEEFKQFMASHPVSDGDNKPKREEK